jgi:hypothetical protein
MLLIPFNPIKKIFLFFLIIFFSNKNFCNMKNIEDNPINQSINDELKSDVIIDCNYNLKSALNGLEIPSKIKNELSIVDVFYFSFDKKLHKGQIVINTKLSEDIQSIFEEIRKHKFPVGKVIPIVKYNWSDSASMEDNNSSGFNYRFIQGTKKLSNHSTGCAVDINPLLNPQILNDKIYPSNGKYSVKEPGTISKNSFIVKLFKKLGWTWGGDWKSTKDYQHFEKKIN